LGFSPCGAKTINAIIEKAQIEYCRRFGADYVPAPTELKLGAALATKGRLPANGLRHPPTAETCGWYIWWGEDFSTADDFFAPLCAKHVYEDFPEIAPLLGLPPGYRFLLAGNYVDVWFDASLLVE